MSEFDTAAYLVAHEIDCMAARANHRMTLAILHIEADMALARIHIQADAASREVRHHIRRSASQRLRRWRERMGTQRTKEKI